MGTGDIMLAAALIASVPGLLIAGLAARRAGSDTGGARRRRRARATGPFLLAGWTAAVVATAVDPLVLVPLVAVAALLVAAVAALGRLLQAATGAGRPPATGEHAATPTATAAEGCGRLRGATRVLLPTIGAAGIGAVVAGLTTGAHAPSQKPDPGVRVSASDRSTAPLLELRPAGRRGPLESGPEAAGEDIASTTSAGTRSGTSSGTSPRTGGAEEAPGRPATSAPAGTPAASGDQSPAAPTAPAEEPGEPGEPSDPEPTPEPEEPENPFAEIVKDFFGR